MKFWEILVAIYLIGSLISIGLTVKDYIDYRKVYDLKIQGKYTRLFLAFLVSWYGVIIQTKYK